MPEPPFAEIFRPTEGDRPSRRYLALPSVARARALIDARDPATTRRVFAGMSPVHGPRPDAAGLAVGLLARARPRRVRLDVLGGADSVEGHVAGRLGEPELGFGWRFGPPRPNRKPVGTLVDAHGEVRAFVKLGPSPLTRALVEAESATLARLGPHVGPVELPRILDTGHWREVSVLVSGAIRHTGRPALATARAEAELAVATALGTRRTTLGESEFWAGLRASVASTATDARWAALRTGVARIGDRFGGRRVTLGSWHGDWTAHNIVGTGGGVAAWDWERFAHGVPAGFDPLHHRLTETLESGPDPQDLVTGLIAQARELLAHFTGAGLVDDPALTTVLYLLTLADRYRIDRQDETRSVAASFSTWLVTRLPEAIDAIVDDPVDR